MADIVQPTLPARYPKRKRAQVNYQEEESDIESQHVEEDSQDVDLAPAKVQKLSYMTLVQLLTVCRSVKRFQPLSLCQSERSSPSWSYQPRSGT